MNEEVIKKVSDKINLKDYQIKNAISMLIMDRYNLFGFNLTKDKLDKDNIDNLIKELEIILNSIVMNKNRITDSRIKFIKDTNNI